MRLPALVAVFVAACATSATTPERPPPDPGSDPDTTPRDRDGGGPGAPDAGAHGRVEVPSCRTDLASQLTAMGVPGLSAGIIADGRLVCASAAGHADLERDMIATPDTVFAWASVSKTVTAAALMMLFEEGRLALDDDVSAYLPFSVRNPECDSDPITFRHLLTHTSSIVDAEDTYDAAYTIGDSPVALGDFLQGYLDPAGDAYDRTENFSEDCPGDYAEYSNIALALVGYLVEQISGTPFDRFCTERIFAPLGMANTSFRLADLDRDRVAMPYERDGITFTAHGHVGLATYPDGGLRAPVPELARFLAMFAAGGAHERGRLLGEPTVAEMSRVQYPDVDDVQGLVWFYTDLFGGALLGHDGEDPGTASYMFFDPADGAGVLLAANGTWWDDADRSPAADALFTALLAEARTY
jgi:CubicO group peptidase (beta-lactamase class C family)